tara:strand:+ start:813 stop:1019 length:207 start_codon:yes stop_codon:yes gene_type:complete
VIADEFTDEIVEMLLTTEQEITGLLFQSDGIGMQRRICDEYFAGFQVDDAACEPMGCFQKSRRIPQFT